MLRTYAPAVFEGPSRTFLLDVNVVRVLIDLCIVYAPRGGAPEHKAANGDSPCYWSLASQHPSPCGGLSSEFRGGPFENDPMHCQIDLATIPLVHTL